MKYAGDQFLVINFEDAVKSYVPAVSVVFSVTICEVSSKDLGVI
jgi:hypothetical protein